MKSSIFSVVRRAFAIRSVCLLVAAVLGAPAAWAQTPMTALSGSIRDVAKIPAATVTRESLSQSEEEEIINFSVALRMRDFAGLQARLGHRERIARAEMERTYHPLAADSQRIVDWLKAQGFTLGPDDPSHISVFASGTVSQISRAFGTRFSRVSFRGNERSSAITPPNFPSEIASPILGVNGLQPQFAMQKHSRKQRQVPSDRPGKNSTTGNGPPFLPRQIMAAYGAAGLTQTGSGQTIAIVIDTPPLNSDLTQFWTTCGVPQSLSNITTIQVVSGTLPAQSGEESLDVEWSSSIAPAAKVRVYATKDLSTAHLDQAYARIYSDLASQPTIHQVSLSYGLGELFSSTSQMSTDEQYFSNLLSAGVTVFASSGDAGSNPDSNGNSGGSTPNVENPASSPSVMGVGGTSLYVNSSTGAESSETVWADTGNGATGGGVSNYFSRPTWQTGNGLPAGNKRAVPDIAAPADPNTGGLVVLNGANVQYGGTSWGSPTWAGIAALINQARASSGLSSLGSLGPRIYPLIGGPAFRDITSGNNGNYSAGIGYDECTGIGVPNPETLLHTLVGGPAIDSQPSAQAVNPAGSATFIITASGSSITYQWMRESAGGSSFLNLSNSSTYSGCTTASLSITNTTTAMNGDSFQCVVTNSYGSATSASARLIIIPPAVPLDIATFAGSAGLSGSTDGTGGNELFNSPEGTAIDRNGNVIVADTGNDTIRSITPAGVVTTLAGSAGSIGSSNVGAGTFNSPEGVAVDSSGNIYVADTGSSTIRKITSAGVVSTLAGTAGRAGSSNTSGHVRFRQPGGVAVDSSGNVYVADTGNHTIRKITSSGTVSLLAGSSGYSGSTDANGSNASFNSPSDVAVDGSGNVYVADTGNHTIRMITPAADVTTLAGAPGLSGLTDGVGSAARFNSPAGLCSDANGNLMVADTGNHTIRSVQASGYTTTLAGLAGSSGSKNGVGSIARFDQPCDIVVSTGGTIYVADTNNQTIRIGTPATASQFTIQPLGITLNGGLNANFSVSATGNPTPSYQWQRLPANTSNWVTLTATPPYSGTTSPTLTITVATSNMSGDQFRCLITNGISSETSSPALLLVNAVTHPSVITSANTATFTVRSPGSFTITATGNPSPTFSATGLPSWASLDPTTGLLSGTPSSTAGSPFTIGMTASNGSAPNATQTFILIVETLYANWTYSQFGASSSDSSIAAPNADPDNDGIPNLLEYAFGSNPLLSSVASLPSASLNTDPTDGKLHLTLTAHLAAAATDVNVTAEISSDLQTWNSEPTAVGVIGDSTSNGIRTVIFQVTTPQDSTSSRFIRLRASIP